MPKVSVIVPVYNVERYLPLCLDSIRAQTFEDFEVVCVNDGSPDRSRDILSVYEKLDSRFILIDKENGGLSSARNAGLRVATGEIVLFVDSDDELVPNALERVVDTFESTHPDVVTFGASGMPDYRLSSLIRGFLSPRDVQYDGFKPDLLFGEHSHPYVWRTACSRRFLTECGLFFDEDILFGEDEVFLFSLYPRSNKTILISEKLYRYRVNRRDSLMDLRREGSFRQLHDHLRIVEHICADWKTAGFLDRYYAELLHHIGVFVLHEVIVHPSDNRMILLRYLRAILETYFTPDQLQVLLTDRVFGHMARAVLRDGTLAWRLKRRLLIYEFTFKCDPFELFRALGRRIASMFGAGDNKCDDEVLAKLDADWSRKEQSAIECSVASLNRELDEKLVP